MTVTTEDLVRVALQLAGMDRLPSDSQVHVPGSGLRRILMAMDVGVAELMLARQEGFDAVVAHHPAGGRARSEMYRCFARHVDFLTAAGVPEDEAWAAVEGRMTTFRLNGHTANHGQTVRAAELMGMPLLSLHGPCDEVGRRLLQEAVDDALARDPGASLGAVAASFLRYPEFQQAVTRPWVAVGDPEAPAGRTVVAHGALSNGGADVARAYYRHGVNTVTYIHVDAPSLFSLRSEAAGNLILTGHMTSDWLGINRVVAAWERELGVEVFRLTDL